MEQLSSASPISSKKYRIIIMSVFVTIFVAGCILFITQQNKLIQSQLQNKKLKQQIISFKNQQEDLYGECRNYYRELTNYIDYDLNKKLKCSLDSDCDFLGYTDDENCKIIAYNTKANASPDDIYQYKGGRPKSCPVFSCGDPSSGMEAKCINKKCQIVETECGLDTSYSGESYCDENEYCNHRRQICSNRTNENIKCSTVGDDKCHKKCDTDADCENAKCVTEPFCYGNICDVEGDVTGVMPWEVKLCQ